MYNASSPAAKRNPKIASITLLFKRLNFVFTQSDAKLLHQTDTTSQSVQKSAQIVHFSKIEHRFAFRDTKIRRESAISCHFAKKSDLGAVFS